VENPPPQTTDSAAVTFGCYAMLLLLGVAEGIVGAFQYSRGIGAFPVAAVGFALLVLVTSVLASWGMRTASGGLSAAVGWFVAALVLAITTPGGSIVITNTTAGKWFLFGGAICGAAGVLAGFVKWPGSRRSSRYGAPPRRPGA
jgi:hypothetical protein